MSADTRTEFGLVPEIGAFPSVPADVYHGYDACSNSRLTELERSELHLFHNMTIGKTPTPAMQEGTALHSLVLEPDSFGAMYCVAPECDKRTTAGKETWAKFQSANSGKAILAADAWDRIHRMRDAIHAHPKADALLRMAKIRELSLFWDCPLTGVRCKARLDALADWDDIILLDVKRTKCASPEEFPKAIWNFGYFRQGAFYLDGYNSVNRRLHPDGKHVEAKHFAFIAVEPQPPYAVAVYRLKDEVIDAGRGDLLRLKSHYATARKNWAQGAIPCGYSADIMDVGVPDWAARKLGI